MLSVPPATVNPPLYTNCVWEPIHAAPFDEVIDVRSPGEFALDHIPGAVNLPVLDDAERAEVGTLYQQVNPFTARKQGAARVSANIARHLTQHFADKPKGYRPLLYCWRGGQRSFSMATVLSQIGWRVTVLEGGYRTYRATVLQRLTEYPAQFQYRIVSGATGCAKTRLLQALREAGCQILDLEGLAGHRGSILGSVGPQPTQKGLESQLLAAFDRLDPTQPVWIEAESRRIGNLYLPPALWDSMRSAPGIELKVPPPVRVRYLQDEYADWCTPSESLTAKLRVLAGRHGGALFESWCRLAAAGEWNALVESLLVNHYDPAYRRSTRRDFPQVTQSVELADLTPDTLRSTAIMLANRERMEREHFLASATATRSDVQHGIPAVAQANPVSS